MSVALRKFTTAPGECGCGAPLPIPRGTGRKYCDACQIEARAQVARRSRLKHPNPRSRWSEETRAKHKAAVAAWEARHPGQRVVRYDARLRRLYGLTIEDFNAMLAAQGGVCALCGTDDPGCGIKGKPRRFCVDHDHATGKVRALLCTRCNSALGNLRDDPELMRRAAAYIEAHRAK